MLHSDSTEIFDKILKSLEKPTGVYKPETGDPNYDICIWLQTSINSFLDKNATHLNLSAPHFNLIYDVNINALATRPPNNFIGVTKGLVDYSSFIFRNILRDKNFLNDVLGDTEDQPIIVKYVQFDSWSKFCQENGDFYNSLDYSPKNFKRKKMAEALFQYYVFFIVVHEVGHLKQGLRSSMFEFENKKDNEGNLELQVLEMDADKFAINVLAEHLITFYNERALPRNQQNLFFFEDKKTVVRCSVFILLIMFFMFAFNNKFKKYILEYSHPHPSLRVNYCVTLLLDSFVDNSFLSINERAEFRNQSLKDFGNIMMKVFPNAGLRKFFDLVEDKELQLHHDTLQNVAKTMKNLNGYGKY